MRTPHLIRSKNLLPCGNHPPPCLPLATRPRPSLTPNGRTSQARPDRSPLIPGKSSPQLTQSAGQGRGRDPFHLGAARRHRTGAPCEDMEEKVKVRKTIPRVRRRKPGSGPTGVAGRMRGALISSAIPPAGGDSPDENPPSPLAPSLRRRVQASPHAPSAGEELTHRPRRIRKGMDCSPRDARHRRSSSTIFIEQNARELIG